MQSTNEQKKGEERINVLSEEDIKNWSQYFGISEQQLRNAVFIEGPYVSNVHEYLKRHGTGNTN